MHLTALRALGDDLPVNVEIVGEGSEDRRLLTEARRNYN